MLFISKVYIGSRQMLLCFHASLGQTGTRQYLNMMHNKSVLFDLWMTFSKCLDALCLRSDVVVHVKKKKIYITDTSV